MTETPSFNPGFGKRHILGIVISAVALLVVGLGLRKQYSVERSNDGWADTLAREKSDVTKDSPIQILNAVPSEEQSDSKIICSPVRIEGDKALFTLDIKLRDEYWRSFDENPLHIGEKPQRIKVDCVIDTSKHPEFKRGDLKTLDSAINDIFEKLAKEKSHYNPISIKR